jgi:hypothetical protein
MKIRAISPSSLGAAALAAAMLIGAGSVSAKNTAMRFYGIVRHVSANNIKVYNPVQKKTVSFLIAPKFHNVFKNGSKTTQLSTIAPGQYVEIRFDRKLLGQAHADRINLLDRDNRIFYKQ